MVLLLLVRGRIETEGDLVVHIVQNFCAAWLADWRKEKKKERRESLEKPPEPSDL